MYEFTQDHGAMSSATRSGSAFFVVATLLLGGIAGCASTGDRPDRELAAAEVTIEQAQQSGAGRYGSMELGAAQQKLAAARAAVQRDDMHTARRLAEEASLDAELASATARNRKARSAVDEINETIDVLRDEIAHNQSKRGDLQ